MWLPSLFQATTFLYWDGGIGRPQVYGAVGKERTLESNRWGLSPRRVTWGRHLFSELFLQQGMVRGMSGHKPQSPWDTQGASNSQKAAPFNLFPSAFSLHPSLSGERTLPITPWAPRAVDA